MSVQDAAVVEAIRQRLQARAPGSICPSEVARGLAEDWRPLMARVREVAAGMTEVEATRAGEPVDAARARGPIRLRLRGGDRV